MRVPLSCRCQLAAVVTAVALSSANRVVYAADAAPVAGEGGSTESVRSAPANELTLAAASAAALHYSPSLAAQRAEAAASDARALQARLWLNPQLQMDFENVGGQGDRRGVEQSETTLWVSQPIELGSKRAERRRVADLGRRRVDYQIEARRIAVTAEVRKRFIKTLLAQERRALTGEIATVAADALRTIEARVRAGAAAPAERAQVRILVSRSRLQLQLAEREIIAARRQLAAMWGDSEPSFTAVGNLEDVMPPPPLDELLSRIDRNPEMARWDKEIERRAAAADLERANRIPTVTLTAGARHFNATDDFAVVASFWVPLPVFDRNQAGVLEADELLAKAHAEREAARLGVRTDLFAAYDELQLQFQRISTLGVQVFSDARAASSEIVDAYRRGVANAIDVLAAQRLLLELRDEYFQALADYHSALIDVERLTAAPEGLR